jgi:hypothetical protein
MEDESVEQTSPHMLPKLDVDKYVRDPKCWFDDDLVNSYLIVLTQVIPRIGSLARYRKVNQIY